MKNLKKSFLKKMLNKHTNILKILFYSIIISSAFISQAYAGTPKLVTGTESLAKAVSSWLLLIIPLSAGAALAYQALSKSLCDDDAMIAHKNRLMKNILIGAAIAECADSLVTAILAFYK